MGIGYLIAGVSQRQISIEKNRVVDDTSGVEHFFNGVYLAALRLALRAKL